VARDADHALRGLTVLGQRLAFRSVGALGVLAHGDDVDAVVARARAGNRDRRPHVGVQVEPAPQLHVERAEAAADRRRQRSLQRDAVAADRIERGLRQQLAAARLRGQPGIDEVVAQAEAERVDDGERRIHDFRANAVAADDRDRLVHRIQTPGTGGGKRRERHLRRRAQTRIIAK